MDTPYWMFSSGKDLEKYKKRLEQDIKHLEYIIKRKEHVPDISIYLDKIGSEVHFYELDSIICRDFSGDDEKHFRLLMWFLADHRWEDALEILAGHFIYGKSEEKGK
jgi:hypothetical protein